MALEEEVDLLERPDGARVWWSTQGTGPAVVLVHPFFGDLRLFDRLVPSLVEAGFQAVRFDLRGHGRSSRGDRSTTLEALADDLLAVTNAAGAHSPVLLGHELGGLLCLQAVLAKRIEAQALSLWSVDPAGRSAGAAATAGLVRAVRGVATRPAVGLLDRTWTVAGPGHDAPATALHFRGATTRPGRVLAQIAAAMSRADDLRPRLNELSVPVQALWGDRDRLLRPRAGVEILEGAPHASGGPIADAARLLQLDRPEAVRERLLRWLLRVHPGRRAAR